MENEKIFDKLNELALGQQKIADKIDSHLDEHKKNWDRLTKLYVPAFGIVLPALSFMASWVHAKIIFNSK